MDNNDELPGMLALAQGVAEQRWPRTMDAQVWADEWLKTIAERPEIATDRDTMIGWFSNAIMAGYDTANLMKEKSDSQASNVPA